MATRLSRLVRIATETDDLSELIAAAWSELRRPMAVVDRQGLPLARMPVGAPGRQALAIAATTARGEHAGSPTSRWRVDPLEIDGEIHGFIAMAATPSSQEPGDGAPTMVEDPTNALLTMVSALVADQLRRQSLRATVLRERQEALKRRLVTDPGEPGSAQLEAGAVGLRLAEAYSPAVLVADDGPLSERSLLVAEDLMRRYAADSLLVRLDSQLAVLLFPDPSEQGSPGQDLRTAFESLVRSVRRRDPGIRVHGIIVGRPVMLADLPAQVMALSRLRRYPRQGPAELPVLSEESFALNRLLIEGLDEGRAREFVDAHVGALVAHDRSHHSDLAETLEAALDYNNRDEAARMSYKHRNTFRRHLNQAVELVGVDLDDPHERLAVHVALKLRKLLDPRAPPR